MKMIYCRHIFWSHYVNKHKRQRTYSNCARFPVHHADNAGLRGVKYHLVQLVVAVQQRPLILERQILSTQLNLIKTHSKKIIPLKENRAIEASAGRSSAAKITRSKIVSVARVNCRLLLILKWKKIARTATRPTKLRLETVNSCVQYVHFLTARKTYKMPLITCTRQLVFCAK